MERAGVRLAQLDVTLSGKPSALVNLSKDDFEVWVDLRRVEDFLLDAACRVDQAGPAEAPGIPPASPDLPAPRRQPRPATFVFYFDQSNLTMAGRQQALDEAREMVPRLVRDGNRAMVLSNAQTLSVAAPLTTEAEAILAALTRLEKDPKQWDPYPTLEPTRIEEILDLMNDPRRGGVSQAVALARRYQVEESWRYEKAVRRLEMVLGRLEQEDPPKALLYFADTLRSRPGAHYLEMFSDAVLEREAPAASSSLDASGGGLSFDRVVNRAAAHGVRIYTVQAEGLVAPTLQSSVGFKGAYSARNASSIPMARVREAQDTLGGLAGETGGQAFLNGVPASKIAGRILGDIACLYLVSFDPRGFDLDRPLPVRVVVKRPGVRAQVRGRIVIPSESERLTSRLLAAFSAPEGAGVASPLRASVIPTGFSDGAFSGLIQVAVPGSRQPGASWEMGASLLSRGKVRQDASGLIRLRSAGAPLVLESVANFRPGPYEIVAVARETATDQILSRQIEGSWPDPQDSPALIGPLSLLYPVGGAFLREGAARSSGFLALGDEPLKAGSPAALVGVACRRPDVKGTVRLERQLVGETTVPFEAVDLEAGADLCAVFRDVIPAGTLGPGGFRYEVRIVREGEELARASREFSAVEPRDTAGSSPGSAPVP